jgi:hypothetical protein
MAVRRADDIAGMTAAINMPAKIAMTVMATIISVNVKPDLDRKRR